MSSGYLLKGCALLFSGGTIESPREGVVPMSPDIDCSLSGSESQLPSTTELQPAALAEDLLDLTGAVTRWFFRGAKMTTFPVAKKYAILKILPKYLTELIFWSQIVYT